MVLLALMRGRTAFYTLLPGAPSIRMCASGSLVPSPDSGAGSEAGWWYTPSSCTPAAMTPVCAALFCGDVQMLCGGVTGPGTPDLPWGPRAGVTGEGRRGSQLRAACAGGQARDPLPVARGVLKGSSYGNFWSSTLDESQKQWRRDESFCVPKAIL